MRQATIPPVYRMDWFQSSPRFEAGCDRLDFDQAADLMAFQSSPRFEAGCDGAVHGYTLP